VKWRFLDNYDREDADTVQIASDDSPGRGMSQIDAPKTEGSITF